jgi:ribosomal protein S12 methylthiotransferase
MRGKHVTKPIERVVEEARELARDGVRELILVAQDMTYYGVDLYGRPRLAELLRELDQIEELDWIRILYNYPNYFTEELYEVLGSSKRIVPYLDMPLQHINDRMLKVMNRRHTRAETVAIIDRLRATIPGLVLRTTFIVGFPGETEAEFEEMAEFVAATRFERLGVFTYSLEPDTPAAKLPDQLSDEVKEARRARIMEIQQPIAEEFNRGLVGRTLDVLIDGRTPGQDDVWIGRTFADAPDVDGVTLIRDGGLQVGDIVPCEVLDTQGYDLVARTLALPARRRRARPRPRKRPTSSLTILDGS